MTTIPAYLNPEKRHDFVLLFDVKDGNPNGDPDAGNLPRIDPETMQGLVSDVCMKRKVRNWVDVVYGTDRSNMKIYVQNKEALNSIHARAYEAINKKSTGSKQNAGDVEEARKWICNNFYDVRTFGAVMTTGVNCGQVRGPVQLTFARSIDRIIPQDVSITRMAVTRPEDMVNFEVDDDDNDNNKKKTNEMGRKSFVPYGLYQGFGFFNPTLAEQTGFSQEDLRIFWEAMMNMWEIDRSASRGMIACRGLYIFTHDKKFGCAPAHQLFERISVNLLDDVEAPRDFQQYEVTVNEDNLPEGITLTRLVG
ncbi:type I-C CRISPR-associated protein Cas7/Csd2 [Heliophilum fasciatum]|uniref:CRISPR-associated Csd2 family protein n=1 Tax=Heliophilum fasciatum TaxID=35700 RepID=A0A4R2RE22_9FIRM|nr:type I-C CRISPR-associated protein Cas7/Csd2 [Heliophilum fasciatum]MCW2279030.1 CRISPR-associated protein Csd2 [Heliophilum fasciatum]TCP61732.1 CRISPR-associated Csd2 family protein [Heliophilum fasciatum]